MYTTQRTFDQRNLPSGPLLQQYCAVAWERAESPLHALAAGAAHAQHEHASGIHYWPALSMHAAVRGREQCVVVAHALGAQSALPRSGCERLTRRRPFSGVAGIPPALTSRLLLSPLPSDLAPPVRPRRRGSSA